MGDEIVDGPGKTNASSARQLLCEATRKTRKMRIEWQANAAPSESQPKDISCMQRLCANGIIPAIRVNPRHGRLMQTDNGHLIRATLTQLHQFF